jgi:hypothetical protein
LKPYAIVRDNRSHWLMAKDDFRYETPEYATVADVTKIGKYQAITGHDHKARLATTSDGSFLIFSDFSAKKVS